jgi:adenylosuccinate synthase
VVAEPARDAPEAGEGDATPRPVTEQKGPAFWIGVGLLVLVAIAVADEVAFAGRNSWWPLVLVAAGIALWRVGRRDDAPTTSTAAGAAPGTPRPHDPPQEPTMSTTTTRVSEYTPPPVPGRGAPAPTSFEPPPAPRRARSYLGRVTIALAFIAAGVTVALDRLDVVDAFAADVLAVVRARDHHRRRPVGRRGQGQGHRPAGRHHRPRRPLPGRQQRRPHRHRRRPGVQAAPDPVGILYPHVTPVIADGVVIDPKVMLEELDGLEERGLDPFARVKVSGNAHLIMPYHRELDLLIERRLGKANLGTTKRGIGPAYADKASRVGLRFQDLFDEKIFRQKLEAVLVHKNEQLAKIYNRLPMDARRDRRGVPRLRRAAAAAADRHHRADPHLARGRQAHHPRGRAGHAARPRPRHLPVRDLVQPGRRRRADRRRARAAHVDRVIGITKAYVTRVGTGPFPTELFDEVGERMTDVGGEYGTTTGRRRRVGWFDAVLARYANRVNGFTDIFLTKLDVLSEFETLKVATAYRYEGEEYTTSRRTSRSSTTPSRSTRRCPAGAATSPR